MSLYNLVHGENPFSSVLLAMLGITRNDVPRYRDCFWTGEHIAIHTRTGGGNRDSYDSPESRREAYPEIYDTEEAVNAGPFNRDLQALPTYVRDEDDDFDSTYATFYFTVPEAVAWVIPQLQAADATPAQKWHAALDKLKTADESDPQVKRIMGTMRPLFEQIVAAVNAPPSAANSGAKE